VTKRDGRTEDFIAEKIVVSCLKVGAPVGLARQIAKDIESKATQRTGTAQIRMMVLEQLRQKNPEWEQNWLVYDRAVKKRK